jgi:TPR repeat protein
MDDLSTQQQKIVDAIALNWDAIPTKEIATKTRMESKAVSSHIKLLEKNRIIHKIKTNTKNHLYQVSERFFNIWYLMRCGRRNGINRVQWLVHFLQSWCGEAELMERAQKHMMALEKGTLYTKYAFYLTKALAGTKISDQMKHDLITHTREFLIGKDEELIKELSKSDIELFEEATRNFFNGKFEKSLQNLETIKNKDSKIIYCMALIYEIGFKDFEKAKHYYLQAVEKGNSWAMNNLASLYKIEFKDFNKAEKYYLMAVEKGHHRAMSNLSWMYFLEKRNKIKALTLIKEAVKAVKKEKNYIRYSNLSIILLWNNEIEESLKIERELMESEEYIEKSVTSGSEYLILLLAKKQYYAALKMFEESSFDLKERLKPIYYALMYFLKDDYPNEYKKMGAELKETVEEIINKVLQWENDYA